MKAAETLADVVSSVHATLTKWRVSEADTDIWFRGVDKARHLLQPKIFRKECRGMDPDNLFYRFQTNGASHVQQRPDVWEWYFIAQHNGLPTRLLDWTDNLYTAVYFALAPYFDRMSLTRVIEQAESGGGSIGAKGNPPVVWVLDAGHLNRVTVGMEAILVPGGARTNLWHPEKVKAGRVSKRSVRGRVISNERPIALLPPRTSARIIAQQGVFTIHGSGSLPLNAYYGNKPGHRLQRISLNPQGACAMWRDLLLCGINHFSVFPDLPNLAKHVSFSNA